MITYRKAAQLLLPGEDVYITRGGWGLYPSKNRLHQQGEPDNGC